MKLSPLIPLLLAVSLSCQEPQGQFHRIEPSSGQVKTSYLARDVDGRGFGDIFLVEDRAIDGSTFLGNYAYQDLDRGHQVGVAYSEGETAFVIQSDPDVPLQRRQSPPLQINRAVFSPVREQTSAQSNTVRDSEIAAQTVAVTSAQHQAPQVRRRKIRRKKKPVTTTITAPVPTHFQEEQEIPVQQPSAQVSSVIPQRAPIRQRQRVRIQQEVNVVPEEEVVFEEPLPSPDDFVDPQNPFGLRVGAAGQQRTASSSDVQPAQPAQPVQRARQPVVTVQRRPQPQPETPVTQSTDQEVLLQQQLEQEHLFQQQRILQQQRMIQQQRVLQQNQLAEQQRRRQESDRHRSRINVQIPSEERAEPQVSVSQSVSRISRPVTGDTWIQDTSLFRPETQSVVLQQRLPAFTHPAPPAASRPETRRPSNLRGSPLDQFFQQFAESPVPVPARPAVAPPPQQPLPSRQFQTIVQPSVGQASVAFPTRQIDTVTWQSQSSVSNFLDEQIRQGVPLGSYGFAYRLVR